ncbi:HET-domain-containing protein [Lepidopterella palustris CBS 459.81]|uniref:HET-domain-containing protein n=1 Tax=Lepidopterella palustris CBS 459.81 TaxID=1314670 RepID=A0A8E2DX35_9PEZI|nr:HET-domain-containing protein [Lepidopterella palustris CBS 459.81]
MSTTYEYTPLRGQRSIRILHLKPSERLDSPLCCNLEEASLDDKPNYEALSYVWGAPDPESFVLCGENRVAVTPNCVAALRRFRYLTEPRALWVDAICINQNLRPEKSQQVAIMKDVYGSATQVLIWLGDGTRESKEAFRCIGKLAALHISGVLDVVQDMMVAEIKQLADKLYDGRSPKFNFLLAQFMNEYFSRVWTVQEIAVARKAEVTCGTDSLPWSSLVYGIARIIWMRIFQLPSEVFTHFESHFLVGGEAWTTASPLHRSHFPSESTPNEDAIPDLIQALSKSRHLKATNPRDRLYAMLWASGSFDLPAPDYEKSTVDIYTEFTKAVIQAFASTPWNLDLLRLINGASRSQDLPSWVPDWSDNQPFEFNSEVYSGLFFATGRTCDTIVRFSDKDKKLHVYGRKFGDVERRSLHVSRDQYTDAANITRYLINVLSMLRIWKTEAESLRRRNGSMLAFLSITDGSLEEFMTTILRFKPGAKDLSLFDALLQLLDLDEPEFSEWEKKAFTVCQTYGLRAGRAGLMDRFDSDPEWNALLRSSAGRVAFLILLAKRCGFEWIQDIFYRTGPHNTDRAFFTTSNGYMGTAFHTVQVGDDVVLLSGCRVPMLLRPEGTYYRAIGPAYVHGIMQDDSWSQDRASMDEFILV